MGFCGGLVNFILFVINFLCFLCGAGILIVGVIFYLHYKDLSKLFDSTIISPPIFMIVIGGLVFIIAFYGCCGAITKSRCMLLSYAIILLIILIGQITLGVLALVYGTDVGEQFRKVLDEEFHNAKSDNASFDVFNALQTKLECCGVNGPEDYGFNLADKLRLSCCVPGAKVCVIPNYTKGCANVLIDFVENNSNIAGGIVIGVGLVEIIGSMLGFVMASSAN